MSTPNLMSTVVAWSLVDGTGRSSNMAGDADEPPYPSVLAAMKDGWRVIQVPVPIPAPAGQEHQTAFLRWEYILEKLVDVGGDRG
ncbi:MAG: hypothetical protein ABIS92_18065 [Polyangia bacterium]